MPFSTKQYLFRIYLLIFCFIHNEESLRLFIVLYLLSSPYLWYLGTKTYFIFLVTCEVSKYLFFFRNILVICALLSFIFHHLITWYVIAFILVYWKKWQFSSSDTLNSNHTSSIHIIWKPLAEIKYYSKLSP